MGTEPQPRGLGQRPPTQPEAETRDPSESEFRNAPVPETQPPREWGTLDGPVRHARIGWTANADWNAPSPVPLVDSLRNLARRWRRSARRDPNDWFWDDPLLRQPEDHPQSRHRRRTANPESDADPESDLETRPAPWVAAEAVLLLLALAGPWALGAVDAWAVLLLDLGVGLAALLAVVGLALDPRPRHVARFRRALVSWPSLALVALILLALLQAAPLPETLVAALNPPLAEIQRNLLPETLQPIAGDSLDPVPLPTLRLTLDPEATRHQATRFVQLWLLFQTAVLVVGSGRTARAALRRLAVLLVLNGVALVFFAILQAAAWNGKIYGVRPVPPSADAPNRAWAISGPYIHHGHFADALNFSLGMGLGMLLVRKPRTSPPEPRTSRRRRSRSGSSGSGSGRSLRFAAWGAAPSDWSAPAPAFTAARWWLVYACAILALGVVASQARGGVLALAAALVFLVLALRPGIKVLVASLGAVALAVALFLAVVGAEDPLDRIRTLGDANEKGYAFRFAIWRDALHAFAQRPILGVGLGAFQSGLAPDFRLDYGLYFNHVENQYLTTLAEGGIVAAALAAAAILGALALALRAAVLAREPRRRALVLGALFGVVALMVHNLGDYGAQIPANGYIAVLILGILGNFSLDQASNTQGARARENPPATQLREPAQAPPDPADETPPPTMPAPPQPATPPAADAPPPAPPRPRPARPIFVYPALATVLVLAPANLKHSWHRQQAAAAVVRAGLPRPGTARPWVVRDRAGNPLRNEVWALQTALAHRPDWYEGWMRLGLAHVARYRDSILENPPENTEKPTEITEKSPKTPKTRQRPNTENTEIRNHPETETTETETTENTENTEIETDPLALADPLVPRAADRLVLEDPDATPDDRAALRDAPPVREHLVPAARAFQQARRCAPRYGPAHLWIAAFDFLLPPPESPESLPFRSPSLRRASLSVGPIASMHWMIAELALMDRDLALAAESWARVLRVRPDDWSAVAQIAAAVLPPETLLDEVAADGKNALLFAEALFDPELDPDPDDDDDAPTPATDPELERWRVRFLEAAARRLENPAHPLDLALSEAERLYLRGQALARLDRPEQARTLMERALELEPRRSAWRRGLVDWLLLWDQVEAAYVQARVAATLDPLSPDADAALDAAADARARAVETRRRTDTPRPPPRARD